MTNPAALPPELQAAIDRAAAKALDPEFVITVEREFFEQAFEFKFRSKVPTEAMTVVGHFQQMAKTATGEGGQQDIETTMDLVVQFLDAMATPETGALIGALMRQKIVGLPDLVSLQKEVMERTTGRPFESPSSSASGSPESGQASTGGALLGVSTLPS